MKVHDVEEFGKLTNELIRTSTHFCLQDKAREEDHFEKYMQDTSKLGKDHILAMLMHLADPMVPIKNRGRAISSIF